MELSLFYTQLFGVYFVVASLLVFWKQKELISMVDELLNNRALSYVVGIFTFFMGLAIVLTHNTWEGTPQVIVTITAWLTLLKGLLYMFFPQALRSLAKVFIMNKAWSMGLGFIIAVIGLYLVAHGFSLL